MTSWCLKLAVAFAVALLWPAGAQAAEQQAAVELGRGLYFGTTAFLQVPTVAGAPMPLRAAACANCHGALGEGAREGGLVAPRIALGAERWQDQWLHAAMWGRAATGRELNNAMPRYQLSGEEQAGLRAYAEVLGSSEDKVRGISPSEIRLGILLGSAGQAGYAASVVAGVEKVFSQVNLRGGVHGRKLVLQPIGENHDAVDVFALVASVEYGDYSEKQLQAKRLPSLAALNLRREDGNSRVWSAPLLASLEQQSALLASELAAQSRALNCTPYLFDPTQVVKQGNDGPRLIRLGSLNEAMLVKWPPQVCIGVIANPVDQNALFAALARSGSRIPLLVSLAALTGAQVGIDPQAHWQIMPAPLSVASHAARSGQTLWTSFGEAAALCVVEALARSGRLLQPEIVLATMRNLTGFAPLQDAAVLWSRARPHGWPAGLLVSAPDQVAVHQLN